MRNQFHTRHRSDLTCTDTTCEQLRPQVSHFIATLPRSIFNEKFFIGSARPGLILGKQAHFGWLSCLTGELRDASTGAALALAAYCWGREAAATAGESRAEQGRAGAVPCQVPPASRVSAPLVCSACDSSLGIAAAPLQRPHRAAFAGARRNLALRAEPEIQESY